MNLKKALCSYLALLATASLAETYSWQGPAEGSITGGAWGEATNWLVGSDRAEQVPAADDVAQFVSNPQMTVTLDKDYTVSNVFIPQGDANKPRVTLDLGGHTLSVTNAIRIQKSWDDSHWIAITNGTVTTRTVSCGIAKANEWDWGAGRIILRGPDAELYVTNALSVIGKFSRLQIGQGAKVNCNNFEGSTGQTGGSAEISGTGSLLTVRNDFQLRDYFVMTVSEGGKLSVTSTERAKIGRIRSGGRGTILKIDGGTFETTKADVTVGDADTAKSQGCQLILTNNATMTMAKSLYLGRGHLNAVMTNHTLTVANGSTLTGGASSDILAYGMNVDKVYFSGCNNINVLDASVSVRNLKFGNLAKPVSSNGVLTVAGPRAKIALSGTAATAFQLRMGVDLRITIPETGFVATPIQIPNGGATVLDDAENGAKQVGFFFDAGAYSRKHKGRPVTLIECGLDSAESLQRLADNVTYVNTPENLRGTLEVVDGKKLVYNPPPAPGLMLLLK